MDSRADGLQCDPEPGRDLIQGNAWLVTWATDGWTLLRPRPLREPTTQDGEKGIWGQGRRCGVLLGTGRVACYAIQCQGAAGDTLLGAVLTVTLKVVRHSLLYPVTEIYLPCKLPSKG